MSTGIRQRIITYDLQQAPHFLKGISITVTEGIVEIDLLKEYNESYASVSVDAASFVTDMKFLIEEIENEVG